MNSGAQLKTVTLTIDAGGILPNAIRQPTWKFFKKFAELLGNKPSQKRIDELNGKVAALVPHNAFQALRRKAVDASPRAMFENARKLQEHASNELHSEISGYIFDINRVYKIERPIVISVDGGQSWSRMENNGEPIHISVDSKAKTVVLRGDWVGNEEKSKAYPLSKLADAMDFVRAQLINEAIARSVKDCLSLMILYYNQIKHKEDPSISPSYSLVVGGAKIESQTYPQVAVSVYPQTGKILVGTQVSRGETVKGDTVREYSKEGAGDAILYAFKIFDGINKPNCHTYWC